MGDQVCSFSFCFSTTRQSKASKRERKWIGSRTISELLLSCRFVCNQGVKERNVIQDDEVKDEPSLRQIEGELTE